MLRALLVLGVCATTACGGGAAPSPRSSGSPSGPPVTFSFVALDGTRVDHESTRNRATVVLFFTSYDVISQMAVRVADEVQHTHQPRINVVGVAMEAPKYDVLVRAFGEAMGLDYPVVMADRATLSGVGAFGAIVGVPTWVVLDPRGRVVFRRVGALRPEQLRAAVAEAVSGRK